MNLTGNKVALLDKSVSNDMAYVLKEMHKGYRIPLVSDVMFRTMFFNESRKKYGCYLIALLLNQDYNEVFENTTLIKPTIDEEKTDKSRKTVDYLCRIDGVLVNVEMNKNKTRTNLERNLDYMFRLHGGGMKIGDNDHYESFIQININNFTFEGKTEVLDEYMIVNLNNIDEIYTNKVHIFNIYLPNIRKKDYNKLEDYEKLLLVFNEEDDEILDMLSEGDDIMKDYINDSKNASEKDEVKGMYDKELNDEMLKKAEIRKNREEAYNEGIIENKKETALKMIQDNLTLDVVAKYTGLSLEELNVLKEEIE